MIENRFTKRAEIALELAQKAAMELGNNYVGTEHVLLGLVREGEGVAAKALASCGVTDDLIIKKIELYVGIGDSVIANVVGLTPRTKRVLELSYAEARRAGHNYIGTEHLLLAILREGENVAFKIIQDFRVNTQKLYNDIMSFISEQRNEGEDSAGPSSYNNGKKYPTPTLEKFGRNLNDMARDNKFDPIIGRDGVIERVIQVLSRRTKNNPCLIGEPGVGKTAVAEGLAQKIINGSVPEILRDKIVFTLDLSSMVAGAKYRGEFEDRLKNAMEEIRKAGNIILFIDEIHTIVGAGAAEGSIDAANILKPSLSRGEIQVIGATTLAEYRKYVEKDAALERRFQPITVDEPTAEESIEILRGIRDKYEAHHKVEITDGALNAAVRLSVRYIPDRFLPDKAIDLVDEAASRVKLNAMTTPKDLKIIEGEVERLRLEKEEAITNQEFEKAASLRDEEQSVLQRLNEMRNHWKKESRNSDLSVTEEDIAAIVSNWMKIPVQTLTQNESERLLKLEEVLHERVIGQDEAVSAIAKAIRRGRVNLSDPKRPNGSFIFLGPTGVGKTELSKALAEAIFGTEDALIRLDMSEYMEKHNVSRMVGSPPGYIGYDEGGGQLTEQVRRKPYSVVLFDEIEKAHPEVFNMLLQILEDGQLTDSHGRKVSFRNTIIIMTSNLGARMITENKRLGFGAPDDKAGDYEKIKSSVLSEVKREFKPEFLNRVDEIIVFHQLDEDNIKEITRRMLEGLTERIGANGITVNFTDELVTYIAKSGFDPVYGARPLRRAIQSSVEDFIAEHMLTGDVKPGDNVTIGYEDEKVIMLPVV